VRAAGQSEPASASPVFCLTPEQSRSHHLPLAPPRDELPPPELREDDERLDDDPPDDDLCRRGMVTVRDVWWPQWAHDVSTRLVPELEYVGLWMIVVVDCAAFAWQLEQRLYPEKSLDHARLRISPHCGHIQTW
jgi:hypothetical protein